MPWKGNCSVARLNTSMAMGHKTEHMGYDLRTTQAHLLCGGFTPAGPYVASRRHPSAAEVRVCKTLSTAGPAQSTHVLHAASSSMACKEALRHAVAWAQCLRIKAFKAKHSMSVFISAWRQTGSEHRRGEMHDLMQTKCPYLLDHLLRCCCPLQRRCHLDLTLSAHCLCCLLRAGGLHCPQAVATEGLEIQGVKAAQKLESSIDGP